MTDKGLLIFPQWLVTAALEVPRQGYGIRVVDDHITDVAPKAELLDQFPQDEVWDRPDQVLMPAFVDAHTHLYGVLAHGIPLTKAPDGFMPFLEDFWWPLVEDRLDHEMIADLGMIATREPDLCRCSAAGGGCSADACGSAAAPRPRKARGKRIA